MCDCRCVVGVKRGEEEEEEEESFFNANCLGSSNVASIAKMLHVSLCCGLDHHLVIAIVVSG